MSELRTAMMELTDALIGTAQYMKAAAAIGEHLAKVPALIEGQTKVAEALVENITRVEAVAEVLQKSLGGGGPEDYIRTDERDSDKEYKVQQIMDRNHMNRSQAERHIEEVGTWAALGRGED